MERLMARRRRAARGGLVLLVCLLVTAALASCGRDRGAGGGGQAATGAVSAAGSAARAIDRARLAAAAASHRLDGSPVSIAGVIFTPPSVWQDLGASGMRQANFEFGPVAGDADKANCAVFYFGPGGGGGVRANIERWLGQMSLPGGGDAHTAARESRLTADGMTAHLVEVSGTYNGGMGGGMASAGPQDGYHMVAAVLEAPGGNLFFKITGPENTARAMGEALLAVLQGVKKES